MKNFRHALFILICFVFLWATACTPPPPNDTPPADDTETEEVTDAEESNGDIIQLEDESFSDDGMTFTDLDGNETDESNNSEEPAEEEPKEEIDEPMTDTKPDRENIFNHYEKWPPERITKEEVEILKQLTCVLETSKGTIRLKLFPDEAPIHSANFVKLIQDGFYDGLTFHRVIKDFMTQGGDPEGTGTGGPGYNLPAEISLPHSAGSLAAARQGDEVNPMKESSGSQFYMCHTTEGVQHLNGQYSVFGQIIEGQDVNLALNVTGPGVVPDKIIRAYIVFDN